MIILLFGPPGCGKGTQAAFLGERLQIPSISTGEMFRAECKAGTRLGRRARDILARGGLIGDEIVNAMVAGRIAQRGLLRRFPAGWLPANGRAGSFLHCDCSISGRFRSRSSFTWTFRPKRWSPGSAARRQCPRCLRLYNVLSQPPRIAGVCDEDGARARHPRRRLRNLDTRAHARVCRADRPGARLVRRVAGAPRRCEPVPGGGRETDRIRDRTAASSRASTGRSELEGRAGVRIPVLHAGAEAAIRPASLRTRA